MTAGLTTTGASPTGTSAARLVAVELRRLWWRRLTKALLVLAVLFTGMTVYGTYQATSSANLEQQLRDYQQTSAQFPEMLRDCQRAQAEARQSGDADADLGCSEMTPPTPQDLGLESPQAGALTVSLSATNAALYAFLALVLGASFVGAEFSSGSLGTWLTFEPRRHRVAASKLVAAAAGGAAIAALGLALTVLGAWVVSQVNRPDPALQLPTATGPGDSVTQMLLRCLLVGVIAAVAGVALALLVRNTGAVVAIVLGYSIVVEGIIAQGLGRGGLVPWLPLKNLEAFIQRGTTYFTEQCTAEGCQSQQMTLSYTHGWVYLSVFMAALVAVALWLFRRRDVS
ncbi:MAG: ABC transporter permease subunit [Intrasporangium sp.]|uniref:ABC transporter permease subunit n=1 Tax=Intrasporangium sp. TaxID=1925024 RepID=UPI00264A0A05|nr:ABC transporter permease subunit [Intrasporangium sp.]MDN5797773.1 ABC transporter permease subunit [Intrasporangium sp.]